jgi:replicative DNA helicase
MMMLAQSGREAAKEARKSSSASPELDQIQESDNPAQKATLCDHDPKDREYF